MLRFNCFVMEDVVADPVPEIVGVSYNFYSAILVSK